MAGKKKSKGRPSASSSAVSRFMPQVEAETELRYGPQLGALAMLLGDAEGQRNQALSVNASAAQALQNAARLAKPDVSASNQAYLDQLGAAKSTLGNPDMAAYAGSDDPFKQALARDFANAQVHAAETTKAAGGELTQRGLDAGSARQAADREALAQFGQAAEKIGGQQQSVTSQAGLFRQSRLAELVGDYTKVQHETAQARADRDAAAARTDATNAQSDRNSIRSSGFDPDTGQPLPGGKADPRSKRTKTLPGGAKLLSPQTHGAARDDIDSAVRAIRPYVDEGVDRHKVASLFLNGSKQHTDWSKYEDLKRQHPDWADSRLQEEATVPAVASVPQLWLSVALDRLYDGHVSARNVKELHSRGYSVNQLGLPVDAPKKKKQAARVTTTGASSSTGGLPMGPVGPVSPVG